MPKTPDRFNPPEGVKKEEKIETQTEEEVDLNLVEESAEENKEDLSEHEEKVKEQERQQIESLREQITEKQEKDNVERDIDLIKRLRLPRQTEAEPVSLTPEQKKLISEIAEESEESLKENYEQGYGIYPAADPKENFYRQIWTRDFAHASGNYFAEKEPWAITDSLTTIFKHQREDGMLPLRVEKEYLLLKVSPLRFLAKPLFNLIEKRFRGRDERPVYEGQDFSSAQDTVPTAINAIGEFFINSQEGKEFVKNHFDQIKKSIDFFRGKSDPEDGLISVKKGNADWADSINRQGKLGNINVLWARSLRLMEFMAKNIGRDEDAKNYREEFHNVKNNIMEKLYNKEQGYFRTAEGEDRIDTVASVFGSLYLLTPAEAAKVQETLKQRVKTPSGLKNFDPPYPKNQILPILRLIGHGGYHNEDIWPWVTCQNIQAKIKIGLNHPDENIKKQYKEESVNDLADMADLFEKAGGAYEIFRPNDRKPAVKTLYKPPKNIMGNRAAYQGAYQQLKELGWI